MKISPRCIVLTLFASAALVTAADAQAPSVPDQTFVKKASVGNTFEIDEAKLAMQRATDPRLKQFAQKMIEDHGSAEKKLQAASRKEGEPAKAELDAPHQAMLDNLQTFNGTDFDKIYTADQVAAHAETVALLSDYKQKGGDSKLEHWADTTLPVVKSHQAMINAM